MRIPPPGKEVISPVIGTCLPGFLDHTDGSERSHGLGLLEPEPQQTWSCRATFRVRPLDSRAGPSTASANADA